MCRCDRWNGIVCAPCRDRQDDALASLRARLNSSAHDVGEGDVTFLRTDGREVTIRDVRVESVGPSAEAPGVIGVEFFDSDKIVHVPFVESWTFDYRV